MGGTPPSANDDLVFPSGGLNKTMTNDISSGTSFNSITFQATSYSIAGNDFYLVSGITFDSGSNSATISANIKITSDVTMNIAGTNSLTISGVISENTGHSITKTGTGLLTLSAENTFSGGLVIKAGTVRDGTAVATTAFGLGTITLGNTTGSDNVLLQAASTYTYLNAITVETGSSGTKTIQRYANSPIFDGAITLTDDLILLGAAGSITVSGAIGGTGDLTINANGSGAITLSGDVDFTGTVTNSGTSTGNTTINGIISTNVTGVIQNSTTSQLKLGGVNTFTCGLTIKAGEAQLQTSTSAGGSHTTNGAGKGIITLGDSGGSANAKLEAISAGPYANPITVASGSSGNTLSIGAGSSNPAFSGAITLSNNLTIENYSGNTTISGGISGTGNVILSSSGANTITLSTSAVNFTGTITHSGAGTGLTTISAVIGTSVTGVTQNSTTSALTLSGVNTMTGNITNTAGTLTLTQSATYNVLTLGADSITKITSGKTLTLTNIVSNGTSGHLAILNSVTATSAHILTTAAANITVNYLQVQDSTPVQTNVWYVDANSTLVSNTGNWQQLISGGYTGQLMMVS